MKVLFINHTIGIGSTGRICTDLATKFEGEGHECKIAYGRNICPPKFEKYAVRIGNKLDNYWHVFLTRVFDWHGYASKMATKKFLQWADEYNPDLLWLHNIHGYYINIEMLFDWIKSRPNMEVKWTLHDCWTFTGHCSHFMLVKCEQWQTHCSHCCQKHEYPASILMDNCFENFDRKRKAFTGVKKMTLITPSQWLADLVKISFIKEYPVEVHYNTIDTNIFKPTPSDLRKRLGLEGKKVVLGVANIWSNRKGLDDFFQLSKMLDDSYVIVLVGLTPKQIRQLPKKIKGLARTNSIHDLVAMYSMADIFVNPSKEETFGLTTLEATSCGKTAIVYEGTACEEVIRKTGGVAVPQNVQALYKAIISHI